jgi:hypothetical protein
MNPCKPNIDALKDSLRIRYREKVENEVPNNGACGLAFVIIDALLEITQEMLEDCEQALRSSIGYEKPWREPVN